MPQPWLDLDTTVLAQTRVFDLRQVQRASPKDGRPHAFWVLDPPDWVNVVALTDDGMLLFVEQWRHGTREVTTEIPAGMVDPGETAEQAARRELLEETGYEPGSLVEIGCVEPNPAIQSNRCRTFLAKGCRPVRAPHFDTTEDCRLRLEPAAQAAHWVRSGKLSHALVVAALTHAFLRGDLPV